MAVIGLDHLQLAIPEGGEDRARAFFAGIVGMNEVPKPTNLSASGCWFECGGFNLHIGVDPEFRPARKAHPALLVDDLAEIERALEENGYPIREDKPIAGYIRIFTEDPFGNRIEIMQRVPA